MYRRGVKKENIERYNNTVCVNHIQVNVSEGRVQPISVAVTKPPARLQMHASCEQTIGGSQSANQRRRCCTLLPQTHTHLLTLLSLPLHTCCTHVLRIHFHHYTSFVQSTQLWLMPLDSLIIAGPSYA